MKQIMCMILAAGKSTRMKSELPKVLHKICGQAMIDYLINLIREVGIEKILVVIGHKYDLVKRYLGNEVETIRQDRLLGTADAVLRAKARLERLGGDVLILYADTPLLKLETLKKLLARHRTSQAVCTLLTSEVKDPTGYGRIVRDDSNRIKRIVEAQDASVYEKAIEEVNAGVYSFRARELYDMLGEVKPDNKKKELYLTDIISILAKRGVKVESVATDDPTEILGINTRSDLAKAEGIMRKRILAKLMVEGVTIIDPETTYIDSQAKIGEDSIIHPHTYIEREVEIGKFCEIGPFARIRGGTKISDEVSIGNFTEVVRSKVGRGTKIRHFSYIGDSTIASGVNIGAGTVTANYDGKRKLKTFIEEGAFIGSGTILVAPVKVGRGAITGAGCVVPAGKDVPPNTVVVGVPARKLRKVIKGGRDG